MLASLKRRRFVEVEQEEGQLRQRLLLQLGLVALLDLLQVEDGLPLGIRLIAPAQIAAHLTVVICQVRLQCGQLLLN